MKSLEKQGLRIPRTYYIYQEELYYIGRNDNQVKINGYRVETDEIVNCIMESELVFDALVFANWYTDNNVELIAYVIPKIDYKEENLKQYLKLQIPTYMIPHKFICVSKFPLNCNGKLDYTVLKKTALMIMKLIVRAIHFWKCN